MVSMIIVSDVSEIYYGGLLTRQSRPIQEGKQGIVWTYAGALVTDVEGHGCRFLLATGPSLVMTSRSASMLVHPN